jgi:type VI secretion system protein ImpI
VTALLHAFCEGAGLEPDAVKPEAAIGLMHMLGRCTRIATEEMMLMLKSRADVKHFTRGGVRTMLSANANNPMKFMPDSQQALELMFVSPRDGFMTGADSFDDALKDIRIHQEAVFRALQPALAEAFAGLSPEEIEQACETTGGNLLSGMVGGHAGAKQWATYVERWDDKAQAGENGVLDAFLQAFAKAYAEASKRG